MNKALSENSIDFIALQQSIVDTSSGAFPDISSELTPGKWQGIFNHDHKKAKDFDEASIYFDSNKWQLTNTTKCGYWKNDDDVRPYVIAYFNRVNSDEKLIFASVHLPHVGKGQEPSVNWNISQFLTDIETITALKENDLKNTKLIIAGDMNEVGQNHSINQLPKLSSIFGNISMLPKDLNSCCKNDGYNYTFDQITTNHGSVQNACILNGELYPIGTDPSDEEHKTIIAEISD